MTIVSGIAIPASYITSDPKSDQDVTPEEARAYVNSINSERKTPIHIDHAITELAAHVAHHKSGKTVYDMNKHDFDDAFQQITSDKHTMSDGSILDLRNFSSLQHVDSAMQVPSGDVMIAFGFDKSIMPVTHRLMELKLVALSPTIKRNGANDNSLDSIELSIVTKPAREGSVICNLAESQNDHEAYIRTLLPTINNDPRTYTSPKNSDMADTQKQPEDTTTVEKATKTVSEDTKMMLSENTIPPQPSKPLTAEERRKQHLAQFTAQLQSMPTEQQKNAQLLLKPLLDELKETNISLQSTQSALQSAQAAEKARSHQGGYMDRAMMLRAVEDHADTIQKQLGMTTEQFVDHVTDPKASPETQVPLMRQALVMSGANKAGIDFNGFSNAKKTSSTKRQRTEEPASTGTYEVDDDVWGQAADAFHAGNVSQADLMREVAIPRRC